MARQKQCGLCGTLHSGRRCPHCKKHRDSRYDRTQRNPRAKQFYNSREWQGLREACGERDRYVCQACRRPAGESYHADHVVPREDGGADELDNLQTLCDRCHGKKSRRELDEGPAAAYLVCGPPCSGKSTWVSQRMKEGDLVLDLDRLKQAISGQPGHVSGGGAVRVALAMWDAARQELKREPLRGGVVYIETTEPDPGRRRHWCGELTAKEVRMPCDEATCIRRLRQCPERMRDREAVERRVAQWFTLAENRTP